MIVIDDIHSSLPELLEFADQQKYYTFQEANYRSGRKDRYRGLRTLNLCGKFWPLQTSIERALNISLACLFFHKHDAQPGEKGFAHQDTYTTAGVVYLRGGPGCGTVIESQTVEFKTNRLVSYAGSILHNPQGFEHDRLVVTFFSNDVLPAELTQIQSA